MNLVEDCDTTCRKETPKNRSCLTPKNHSCLKGVQTWGKGHLTTLFSLPLLATWLCCHLWKDLSQAAFHFCSAQTSGGQVRNGN